MGILSMRFLSFVVEEFLVWTEQRRGGEGSLRGYVVGRGRHIASVVVIGADLRESPVRKSVSGGLEDSNHPENHSLTGQDRILLPRHRPRRCGASSKARIPFLASDFQRRWSRQAGGCCSPTRRLSAG